MFNNVSIFLFFNPACDTCQGGGTDGTELCLQLPSMVPFHGVPRDDEWFNKRAMDKAVTGRVIPVASTPPSTTPKLLRMLFYSLSANHVQ